MSGQIAGRREIRQLRGHAPKIANAVAALQAGGRLPPLLRSVERYRRIIDHLEAGGYAGDLPSRRAIERYWKSYMQSAQLAQ